MVLIKIDLNVVLKSILKQLGLLTPNYEYQHNDNSTNCCTVFYPHQDASVVRHVSCMLGVSNESDEDAKNNAVISAIDHLRVIYDLDILDYNHRELVLVKLNCDALHGQDYSALQEAYQKFAVQYFTLTKRCEKLSRVLKKIRRSFGAINHLL